MNSEAFARARNVVVFEHLVVPASLPSGLATLIGNPLDDALRAELDKRLNGLLLEKVKKYSAPGLAASIKLVYFFLTEGVQGMASGQSLADQQEAMIKKVFAQSPLSPDLPVFRIIGISELRPIFAQVEAQYAGVKLSQFLLKKDGRGGYDTPKFAAALVQLARRDYQRQEMFIRVDDDVQPSAGGIQALKSEYYKLTHDPAHKYFCISWNYEGPLGGEAGSPCVDSYETSFDDFVNRHSIRTTFLAEPAARCQVDCETGRLVSVLPKATPCRLNLVHTKYFIDLFELGAWGSSLKDPYLRCGHVL